ncbi:MAG: hypothetical protein QM758_27055 [Armatimonas sp.]
MKIFTSTRDTTALLPQSDGTLRIESAGGITIIGQGGRATVMEHRECLPVMASFPAPPKGAGGAIVTARLPDGLTAVFGDTRLWQGDKPGPELPPHLREVTALARWQDKLILGVRRKGVWVLEKTGWQPLTDHTNEPYDHNIQVIAWYKNILYASTLDQGLLTFDGQTWSRISGLSTDAPRQLLIHADKLLVRHGDGQIDAFDGRTWMTDAFRTQLPRKTASAIATDGTRLLVLQWGGYSLWDGRTWSHRFDLPDLRSIALTCGLLDGPTLYIGTQGRGLIEISPNTTRRHDERVGLQDDWLTCLEKTPDGTLHAGTFVGGLARLRSGQSRWELLLETRGQQITALSAPLVATRQRVWGTSSSELSQLREAQALCVTPTGLWIGARTALYSA